MLLYFPLLCYPQMVIKIVENYVLIDTIKDLGEIGDILSVYRIIHANEVKIGSVVIVQFKNNMTACEILQGNIRIADHVKKIEPVSKDDSLPGNQPLTQETKVIRKTSIGLTGGVFMPVSDLTQTYNRSLNVGALVKYPILSRHDICMEANYTFLRLDPEIKESLEETNDTKVRASLFMVLVYGRTHVGDDYFIDAGIGLYNPRVTVSVSSSSESEAETGLGFCLGLTILLQPDIYISGKYHHYIVNKDSKNFFLIGVQVLFTIF